jgi:hypothetical protein
MKFRNATPHSLSIIEDDGNIVFMPKDFPAPRLAVTRQEFPRFKGLEGVRVMHSTMGEPEGMPPIEQGVLWIVSALVANHEINIFRSDLVYPGEAQRDAQGNITGAVGVCPGLGIVHNYIMS